MARPARARVDLGALRHNLNIARQRAPHSQHMAIIKANGYGHGIEQVARALVGADAFGVACLEEALAVRAAGIDRPIVLLEGFFEAAELPDICEQQLIPVLHHAEQINMLERARLPAPLHVWLKIDTGMHRLGFPPEEAGEAWRRLREMPGICRVRVMSHFAEADDPESGRTAEQLRAFLDVTADMDAELSIANSAALLSRRETHLDWVRPGLMLYGISPFEGARAPEAGLMPAMTLRTELIAVKQLKAGDRVGYGGTWVCPEDMPVGVAAIGYGDGYPRHAQTGTPVLVNGERAALVGRVSMDMVCIDLRGIQAGVGNEVVLWGPGLPVEEVAQAAGTIPYELVCAVSSRVPMEYGEE